MPANTSPRAQRCFTIHIDVLEAIDAREGPGKRSAFLERVAAQALGITVPPAQHYFAAHPEIAAQLARKKSTAEEK
jgi:hypothetical protein